MRDHYWLWAGVVVWATQVGCNPLECGTGTLEVNGECVGGDGVVGTCGEGTVRNPVTGKCENALLDAATGLCGDNTLRIVDDAGIPHCIGTGGGNDDCDVAPTCPPAASGKVNICGRIYTVNDSQPIDNGDASDGEPYLGVKVMVFEPLGFVNDPTTAPITTVSPNKCGYYQALDLPAATLNGLAAIAVDDAEAGTEDYLLTGVAAIVQAGKTFKLNAWVTPTAFDDAWSTGLAAPSFVKRGVFMPIYIDPTVPAEERVAPFPGKPVAGVVITASGSPEANLDYYFTDTDPATHTAVDTTGTVQTSTGVSGAGLLLDQNLQNYGGTGNEPAGCAWPDNLAAAVPDVVFLQEKVAVTPGTTEACAP